jgi:CubicO group peptidase (beta-lactamase class C family)
LIYFITTLFNNSVTDIESVIQAGVDAGELGGASTLIWRRGRLVHRTAIGWRDVTRRLPMEPDTLFRIASLSKPITTVAALQLLEEGRFALDDPIARWAPEFARPRVLRSLDARLDDTVEVARPITFDDLLTHRAGLTYGSFHPGPLATAYAEALGGDIDTPVAPDDWIARLAALPLVDQPGAAFHYGVSTDLLGLLVARIDGAPLGDVLRRRIFDPLRMTDTTFAVPRAQRHRCAAPCGFDDAGHLTTLTTAPGDAFLIERPDDMTFTSGGAGLWSTLDDYLAFARLFVGGGAVDGVRILKPETLALMASNRLTPDQRASATMLGRRPFAAGHGYGMGVAVVVEPDAAAPTPCGGGMGAVGWPGAYGGWWRADPNDGGSVLLFLAHNMLTLEQMAQGIGLDVFGVMMQFQRLAASFRAA